MGQERCFPQPVPPFQQGFPHQSELGQIGRLEGELQIPHASVQQFRAAAAGAAGDIAGI